MRPSQGRGGGNVCALSFKTCHFTHIEEEAMSLSVCHYCFCAFLCHCHSLSPSLYRLLPFLLSYVAVSSSCCLSEFDPNRASFINSNESFVLYDCVLCPPFFFKVVLLCLFELLFRGNRPRNGYDTKNLCCFRLIYLHKIFHLNFHHTFRGKRFSLLPITVPSQEQNMSKSLRSLEFKLAWYGRFQ